MQSDFVARQLHDSTTFAKVCYRTSV